MLHFAHGDFHDVVLNGEGGDVFLFGAVGGAGDDLLHLTAAAHHRHAGALDHSDEIAAIVADEKPLFHDESPFSRVH